MLDKRLPPLYLRGPVLITGGSGFIGTHLIAALLAKGAQVINLDNRPPTIDAHRPYWTNCDLLDVQRVRELVLARKPVLVYNMAAHARLDGTKDEMRVNVEGLVSLVGACRGLDELPLVVHASTMVVAGANKPTFDPTEYDPQFGLYAQSKVESEKYLRALPKDVPWVIVRPAVIWGPYHSTFPSQVWRYIRLRLYMHPTNFDVVRSYGYVGNVVHQLIRIAELDKLQVLHQTLYVGDEPLPSTKWLDAFGIALTGRPVRRIPGALLRLAAYGGELSGRLGGPSPINLGRLTRMTTDYAIPMSETYALLGPSPYSLQHGVEETVCWLRAESRERQR